MIVLQTPLRNFSALQAKKDFPIFQQKVRGHPLVYLDSAASTQKPQCVMDAVTSFYQNGYANIHRGIHTLSERATGQFEAVREKVRQFIRAPETDNIIFVRNATEAINLVATSFGAEFCEAGDEIILTHLEHHANIVPWQLLEKTRGIKIKILPIDANGDLHPEGLEALVTAKTKLLAITHVSNVIGTVNDLKPLIAYCHQKGVKVLVDGAQAVQHLPVDVTDLDCDFYVFSGHKLYGPTGVGVLYGKSEWLEAMPPYQGGGNMIEQVTFSKTTFAGLPHKFEAGTPDIAGVIGLGAAIDYLSSWGLSAIARHENTLMVYARKCLENISGVKILGSPKVAASAIAFNLGDIHAHDISTIADHFGVALRAGHHCAMPLVTSFGVDACVRASFGLYNTKPDVDILIEALETAKNIFHK